MYERLTEQTILGASKPLGQQFPQKADEGSHPALWLFSPKGIVIDVSIGDENVMVVSGDKRDILHVAQDRKFALTLCWRGMDSNFRFRSR